MKQKCVEMGNGMRISVTTEGLNVDEGTVLVIVDKDDKTPVTGQEVRDVYELVKKLYEDEQSVERR